MPFYQDFPGITHLGIGSLAEMPANPESIQHAYWVNYPPGFEGLYISNPALEWIFASGDDGYIPANAADWIDPDPTTKSEALDDLAERLTDTELFIATFDAHDVPFTPTDASDWNGSSDPGSTGDAVDQLAERTTDLESASDSFIITAGETLAQRDYAFFKSSDGKWYKIDANASPVLCSARRALVTQSGGIAMNATGTAQSKGTVGGFSSLAPGEPVYASNTPGGYTQTKPILTVGGGQVAHILIGFASSATQIELQFTPVRYLIRDILDDGDTITIEHHADSLAHSREIAAYPSIDVSGVLTEYPSSNQSNRVALKKRVPAGYSANIAWGGTVAASSEFGAFFLAVNAFDGSNSTEWYANAATPNWIRYQFTNACIIRQYAITGPDTARLTFAPAAWTFEGSNDGSSWTVLDTRSSQTGWTAFQVRTFEAAHNAAYTYYRLNISATNGGTGADITQLDLRELAVLTSDQCTGGTATASTDDGSNIAANAFDNTSAVWYSGTAAFPNWIRYQFASGKVIKYYTIQASSAGNQTVAPISFTFEGSNDGSSWTTLDTRTSIPNWAADEIRTFSVVGNSTSYTYYRVSTTATQAGPGVGTIIREIEMFETLYAYTDGIDTAAQGFQIPISEDVIEGMVRIRKVGSPTDPTRLIIKANSGSDPGSVLATSDDIAASALSSSDVDQIYDFSTPYAASNGTQYHLQIEYDGPLDEFNYIEIAVDESSPGYANGTLRVHDGVLWAAASPAADAIFSVNAAGTDYAAKFSDGAWNETLPAILNRFDDGADNNPETNTTFKNNTGLDGADITFMVRII